MLSLLASGVVAFAATTIDDLIILMVLFADRTFRTRHIVGGQLLGFGVLVGASLLGAFAALAVPVHLIGFLGLLPIALGIRHALRARHGGAPHVHHEEPALARSILDARTYQVAAITVADGSDNLGIYIPLFAGVGIRSAAILGVLFLLLVGLLCGVGFRLSRHPAMARIIQRTGHILVPVVLIGLGVFVVWNSGTAGWLVALVRHRS